jgi:hypothetical protein
MKPVSASAFIDFVEIFRSDEQFILRFLIAFGGNDIGRDIESEEGKRFISETLGR